AAGVTPHPPATTPAEQMKIDMMMQAANPDLFAVAAKYFPATAAAGAPKRMSRLTRAQLDATAKALLPTFYASTSTTAMAAVPPDPLQTNYEYAANLSFNAANFTPYQRWVDGLASAVRANPRGLIDCSASKDAPTCLQAESKKFAARAFRGTVADAALARFGDFFATSFAQVGAADATADLVSVVLMSPSFVFRDEVQVDASGFLLPAERLANLSYTLADAPPETLGLSSSTPAASLQSADAVQQTIDEILATPEARAKLLRFFMAWLEVRDVDQFTIDATAFPEFTPEVAAAAIAETRAFLAAQLAAAAPTLKGVTQSTQSFVTQSLSSLYGVKKASATGLVDLDPTQRLGIFTQPAVIASHSGPTTTRLVKRGVFFVRKVMCMPLGNPPQGVDTSLPATVTGTERNRVQTVTAMSPCSACHSVINPFGFMQENYDAIGRWRTTDNGQPIDASVSVSFLDEGPLVTSTPVDALKGFTGSMRFKQCFARQMFRFYTGRDELAADDPVLRTMFFDFANNDEQAIVKLLRTLGNAPAFSQRSEGP
ncbi:MAG: hypothetical protein JWM82_2386, partial [Myxococcales bacterium]|nr:hypothetical protein [Myxococcales bacterium]